MTIKTMIATKKVFDQKGVLRFPGQEVTLDTNPKKSSRKPGEKRDDGLVERGKAASAARDVVAIAAIAPTGPNPPMPQQLPAGSNQTFGGYVGPEGEKLVGEGSEAALQVEEGGPAAVKPAKAAKPAAKPAAPAEPAKNGEGLLS